MGSFCRTCGSLSAILGEPFSICVNCLVCGNVPGFVSIWQMVNFSAVQEDIVRSVRPVGTMVASKGLYPRVDLKVLLKFIGHMELFLAQMAWELLGFVVRRSYMWHQSFPVIELLPTLIAHHSSRSALVVVFGEVNLQLWVVIGMRSLYHDLNK